MKPTPITAILVVLLAAASSAAGQSADEILSTALERYEARVASIDDYTVVQDMMGFETTSYYEKRLIDGHPVFDLVESEGGDDPDDFSQPSDLLVEMRGRAELRGRETVDGHECWVLFVGDPSGLGIAETMPEGEGPGDFEPRSVTVYLDTGDYVFRRMVLEGESEAEGEVRSTTLEALFADYREVEGLLHPFRTEMRMSGAVPGVSRAELEAMQRQLEEMPEARREMVERMMKPQLEQLEKMLEGDGLEFVIQVKELRVNAGPPGG